MGGEPLGAQGIPWEGNPREPKGEGIPWEGTLGAQGVTIYLSVTIYCSAIFLINEALNF